MVARRCAQAAEETTQLHIALCATPQNQVYSRLPVLVHSTSPLHFMELTHVFSTTYLITKTVPGTPIQQNTCSLSVVSCLPNTVTSHYSVPAYITTAVSSCIHCV